MIVCPGCSNESADDAVFCGFCGTKLKDDQPKKTLFAFAAIPPKKGSDEPEGDPGSPADADKETPEPAPAAEEAEAADTIADLDDAAKAALAGAGSGDMVDSVDSGWGLDLDFGDTSTGMPAVTGPNEAVKGPEGDEEDTGSPMVTQQTPSVTPAALALAKAPSADPAETAPPSPAETARADAASPADTGEGVPGIGEAVLKSGAKHHAIGAAPSVVAEGAETAASERVAAGKKKKPDGRATTLLPRSATGDILAPGAGSGSSASTGGSGSVSKEDEKEFFGASLSQYGLAGISKEELESQGYGVSDQEVAAELKQANKRSVGMMVVAILVFGLLIGAIAALMILG